MSAEATPLGTLLIWLDAPDKRFRDQAVIALAERHAIAVHRTHQLTEHGIASTAAAMAVVLTDRDHPNHRLTVDRLRAEDRAADRCEHCRAHIRRWASGAPFGEHHCPSRRRGWWWCRCCKAWRYANPSSRTDDGPFFAGCWRCGTVLTRRHDERPTAPPPARPQPTTSPDAQAARPFVSERMAAFLTQSKTKKDGER